MLNSTKSFIFFLILLLSANFKAIAETLPNNSSPLEAIQLKPLEFEFDESTPDKPVLSLLQLGKKTLSTKQADDFINYLKQHSELIFDLDETSKRTLGIYWFRLLNTEKTILLKEYSAYFLAQYADAVSKLKQCATKLTLRKIENSLHMEILSADPNCKQIPFSYHLYYLEEEHVWRVFDFSAEYLHAVVANRDFAAVVMRKDGISALIDKIRLARMKRILKLSELDK